MQLVEDGHEPTTVPITLGRGAYLLHAHRYEAGVRFFKDF
jgi:hypothetical protein